MQLKENQFEIQGLNVPDICKEFGTPLYVYDAQKIKQQVENLKKAFSGINLKIKYASKALTNISILKLIKSYGCEVDVVSMNEAKMAFLAGYKSNEILFTPSGVSFEEIEEAVEKGLMINIDSIPLLEKFGQQYGSSIPCCFRVNPHIQAGGNFKIQTGHKDSKFGISILQMDEVNAIISKYNIQLVGLHMHTGSDIKEFEAFIQGAELMFNLAKNHPNLKFIDFGSGFKVPYKKDEEGTDIFALGKLLKESYDKFTEEYGRAVEIWFEPGKYLVSECGHFFAPANIVKQGPTSAFVGLDSGLNHLIRPMMYDAYHEIFNVSNPNGELKRYNVVGYICETDNFGWDRELNEVRPGDIIGLKNAGAYCFSMSSNYNSRVRPAEVLVINGEAKLIRERETFEDLIEKQIDVFKEIPV
ncbi:diaminopimelate decarboxylase [Flexithrix dorotheae]|uniref:diaminopimelate decarboxylase n=1 Tax=Flexithrix dorotheae TaxID=70993 RepID=UPI00037671DA|nr:diaminopimelate decarboxylase [Flexithrix dorotheae]